MRLEHPKGMKNQQIEFWVWSKLKLLSFNKQVDLVCATTYNGTFTIIILSYKCSDCGGCCLGLAP